MESESANDHTTRNLASSTQSGREEQEDESRTISLRGVASRTASSKAVQSQPPPTQEATGEGQKTDDEHRFAGAAGLAVTLNRLMSYFNGRSSVDDLDMLCFCLNHLFCRVDFLYCIALPALSDQLLLAQAGPSASSPDASLLSYQTWTQLRALQQLLQRIEPLCQLLIGATESMLDALDKSLRHTPPPIQAEKEWLQTLNQARWDRAMAAINNSLHRWQNRAAQSNRFSESLASAASLATSIPLLEQALQVILVSALALFGEIVPGFQAVSAGDDEGVAMLLFDLMQQADQMRNACVTMLALLPPLIEENALQSRAS